MKKLILLSLLSISSFAHSYSEFICTRSADRSFDLRVMHRMGNQWWVELKSAGQPFRRFLTPMRQQTNYALSFWNGQQIDLLIDLFPDRRPRPYWNYRSDFSSIFYRNGQRYYDLSCEFTAY